MLTAALASRSDETSAALRPENAAKLMQGMGGEAARDPEFMQAAIRALATSGDQEASYLLERLARHKHGSSPVAACASSALETVQRRLEMHEDAVVLLRESSAPPTRGLLRSTSATLPDEGKRLLKPKV